MSFVTTLSISPRSPYEVWTIFQKICQVIILLYMIVVFISRLCNILEHPVLSLQQTEVPPIKSQVQLFYIWCFNFCGQGGADEESQSQLISSSNKHDINTTVSLA